MQRGYHDTSREDSEFESYDRNDVFDDLAKRYLPAITAIMKIVVDSNAVKNQNEYAIEQKQEPFGLIFDIGMSEGNDTEFYLKKGFKVIGVEADPRVFQSLLERFENEINERRLVIYNAAASSTDNEVVKFYHHNNHQGLSGLFKDRIEFSESNFETFRVCTIDWNTLVERHGTPYYLKVDIEGNEEAFLSSIDLKKKLPDFISIECHKIEPVRQLSALGYKRFMLVDQNKANGFTITHEQVEGNKVYDHKFFHSSGPFGRDLGNDEWLTIEEFENKWSDSRKNAHLTWYDCHAKLEIIEM